MKRTLKLIISILLISSFVSAAVAQGQAPGGTSGKTTIDNENIAIEITGGQNVPKFSFWQPGENSTVYRVQFNSMFEIVDSNDNGQYDTGEDSMVPKSTQALAAWSWNFTDIEEANGETTFSIIGDGSPAPVMGNFDLKFVNHLADDAESFKFDVVVDNYSFVSDADNAMLVLAFTLTSAEGDDEAEEDGDTVQFGNGFMQVEETASTGDGDIGVGLTTPSNGSAMAYIAYEKFNGGFEHDPTLGFGDGDSTLPFDGVGLLFAFAVGIPIIIALRRRKQA